MDQRDRNDRRLVRTVPRPPAGPDGRPPTTWRAPVALWPALAAPRDPRERVAAVLGRRRGDTVEVVDLLPLPNRHRACQVAFRVTARDVLAARDCARARGLALLGFWHAHPDGPRAPSAADLQGQRRFLDVLPGRRRPERLLLVAGARPAGVSAWWWPDRGAAPQRLALAADAQAFGEDGREARLEDA